MSSLEDFETKLNQVRACHIPGVLGQMPLSIMLWVVCSGAWTMKCASTGV